MLKAARDLLKAGVFRPTAKEVAKMAGCSQRTLFDQFKSIGGLLIVALEDGVTREHIATLACPFGGPPAAPDDQLSLVKAIVLGTL